MFLLPPTEALILGEFVTDELGVVTFEAVESLLDGLLAWSPLTLLRAELSPDLGVTDRPPPPPGRTGPLLAVEVLADLD